LKEKKVDNLGSKSMVYSEQKLDFIFQSHTYADRNKNTTLVVAS